MKHVLTELKKVIKEDYTEFVLAGDVSATNTSMGIVGVNSSIEPLFILRFKSQELLGISEAINETLKFAHEKFSIQVSKACLAPAGPINPERTYCRLTNVNWDIDVKKVLSDTLLNSVTLINDFEAVGFGIPYLDDKDKSDMVAVPHPNRHSPKPVSKGIKGVVGAGTGLGKAILMFDDNKGCYLPLPSEGGHEDFPVADSFEYELVQSIKDKRGGVAPVEYEDVVSGNGIAAIYDYIIEMEMFDWNAVSEEINGVDISQRPAIISKHAKKDAACRKTMELFARFFARALRNMAICAMARGGMYIAGGIAPKNVEFFTSGSFMKEFEENFSQAAILKDIPVFLIMNYDVSIYGAANVAENFPEMAIRK